MLVILCVFLMIAMVLFAERSGIQYKEKKEKSRILIRKKWLRNKQP